MKRKLIFASSLLVVGILIGSSTQAAAAKTPTPRRALRTGAAGPNHGTNAGSLIGSSPESESSPSTGASDSATPSQNPPASGSTDTLVCRMGGNMVWTLVNQFNVVQTQINGKSVRVPVIAALFDQLKFARSGAPVNREASNLQPGYCGWTNRTMTASDPDLLVADADGFTFNETVLWGNGSTIKGETTMFGGSLSFQNKQAFSMQVTLFNGVMLKVVPGTKPKALSK